MVANLVDLMRRYRATARRGNPTECHEPVAGMTIQPAGFRTESRFGRHLILIDEPAAFGGTDSAPNPAELLLAALGASLSVALRGHAALLGIELGKIQVELHGDLDIRGFFDADPSVRAGFQSVRLTVAIEGDATRKQLSQLMATADRGCPVLDACRGSTPVSIELAS